VTATPATTSVLLNWSADTNATLGYRVTWYSNSSGTSVISTEDIDYSAGTMSSTKFGLTANTQYWYRVSPIDPSGELDLFDNPLIIEGCSIHTVTTLS
jgi:chitodextrinase